MRGQVTLTWERCSLLAVVVLLSYRWICPRPSTPLISILIPVYNSESFLEQCLTSILNQTFQKFEAVFVDDGSTDKSRQILERAASQDKRFHLLCHPWNKGSMIARKTAARNARGKYCCFLDPDDYLANSDALATMVQLMEMYQVDIIQFSAFAFNYNDFTEAEEMNLYLKVYTNKLIGNKAILDAHFSTFEIPHTLWNKVFQRELVVSSFEHLPDQRVAVTEDLCISFMLCYFASSFIGVKTPHLYCYRVGLGKSTLPLTWERFQLKVASQLSVLQIIKSFLIEQGTYDYYHNVYSSIRDGLLSNHIRMLSCQGDLISGYTFLKGYYLPKQLLPRLGLLQDREYLTLLGDGDISTSISPDMTLPKDTNSPE